VIDALDLWRGAGARGVPPGLGENKGEQTGVKAKRERDYVVGVRTYVLRPDVRLFALVFSKRIMAVGGADHRIIVLDVARNRSGDVEGLGMGIFEAIEMHTKTAPGYSTVGSVKVVPPPLSDSMPRCAPFFLGCALLMSVLVAFSWRKRVLYFFSSLMSS
jgi:hypothetical protein